MKKSVKIILVVLIIILVIILILVAGYPYMKNKCIRDMSKYDLTTYKCMSLCPTKEVPFWDKDGIQKTISDDCFHYCISSAKSIYPKYCNRNNEHSFWYYNGPGMTIYGNCFGGMSDDLAGCLQKEVEKYSNIIDLSDYKLGSYPKYDISITNLTCSNGSADMTVTYVGEQQEIKIALLIDSTKIDFSETISSGQTKTFHLTESYITAVTKIQVDSTIHDDLKEGEDNRFPISDRKSCA